MLTFTVCPCCCLSTVLSVATGYLNFTRGMNKVSTYLLTYLLGCDCQLCVFKGVARTWFKRTVDGSFQKFLYIPPMISFAKPITSGFLTDRLVALSKQRIILPPSLCQFSSLLRGSTIVLTFVLALCLY